MFGFDVNLNMQQIYGSGSVNFVDSTAFTNPITLFPQGNFSSFGGFEPLGQFTQFDITAMLKQQIKVQQEFMMALMQIMSNPKINHTPEAFVENNVRPLNYNKHGADAKKIMQLDPEMQQKTMQLLDYAKSQGMEVSITSGYRTKEEQKELQRTRPQYAAKDSPHTRGKAIDICIASGKDSDYEKLAAYAKSIGMRWGGDFSVKERWHFDYNWR